MPVVELNKPLGPSAPATSVHLLLPSSRDRAGGQAPCAVPAWTQVIILGVALSRLLFKRGQPVFHARARKPTVPRPHLGSLDHASHGLSDIRDTNFVPQLGRIIHPFIYVYLYIYLLCSVSRALTLWDSDVKCKEDVVAVAAAYERGARGSGSGACPIWSLATVSRGFVNRALATGACLCSGANLAVATLELQILDMASLEACELVAGPLYSASGLFFVVRRSCKIQYRGG